MLGIDAFRGFTMICMLSEGFGLPHFREHPILGPLGRQFQHVDWNMSIPGDLHFWDLIQPFFMFIVGVVMPVSFARRWDAGETWTQCLMHVLRRSAILIFLGLLARSWGPGRPTLDLINVLAQVAVTYLIAFLLLRQSWRVQAGAALALLAAHTALYEFASAPGVLGPWVKNANIGWYLDKLLLNKNWGGAYATINCFSSAANTIFGMMAGHLLASALTAARKMRILAITGVTALAAGLALSPLIPLNKKIWTASFAIYSTGATLLALLLFYWLCDVKAKQAWAKLFTIVGANSIFIYVFHETQHSKMSQIAQGIFAFPAPDWEPFGKLLAAWLVLAVEVALCVWLYRRKIFLKV
jgi:predicted acyltransferase